MKHGEKRPFGNLLRGETFVLNGGDVNDWYVKTSIDHAVPVDNYIILPPESVVETKMGTRTDAVTDTLAQLVEMETQIKKIRAAIELLRGEDVEKEKD